MYPILPEDIAAKMPTQDTTTTAKRIQSIIITFFIIFFCYSSRYFNDALLFYKRQKYNKSSFYPKSPWVVVHYYKECFIFYVN